MKHVICLLVFLSILPGCEEQRDISGSLDVPNALFEYTAEGNGNPMVLFTGGENVGQKFFPKELKDNFILIHADPSNIDSTVVSEMTFNDILDDIEKLRVSIGVEKIGILGHSMFGLLPLEYALKYPNNVSYVISTGSSPYFNKAFREAGRKYWEEEASDTRKDIREKNREELKEFDMSTLSPSQQFITSYIANTPLRFYDPNFDQSSFWESVELNMTFLSHYWGTLMKDFDNSENYKNLTSPVLVLTGKYDFGAPYFLWDEYDSINPNITLKVYEQAGHNPFLEYPEEFTKDVLEWVNEIK